MYTNSIGDTALNKAIVQKLKSSWNSRVAVRKQRLDLAQFYNPTIPDFPIHMVQFWDDEAFKSVDERTRLRLLAGAWIMYNEKTIYIEDKIINPACQLLLRAELPGVCDPDVKEVIAQTLVDEQFHILMCLEVCNSARERHQLHDLTIATPLLIERTDSVTREAEVRGEVALARMAYALVAEMTINTYLKTLSADTSIQPLNRINTDMHRQDEVAHSTLFKELGTSVYRSLNSHQAQIFKEYIRRALNDFTEPDNSGWATILKYLQIPQAAQIIICLEEKTKGTRLPRNYSAFKDLLDELNLTEEISVAQSA